MTQVIVRSLPGHTYAVEASATNGRHTVYADESREAGGGDLGPEPHALLLSALGSCMAITLRMYADRKQWPLEAVSIHLQIERVTPAVPIFAPEEIEAPGPDGKLPLITVRLDLTGALDPEQRERLHEIAGRCPVFRTLRQRPAILIGVNG